MSGNKKFNKLSKEQLKRTLKSPTSENQPLRVVFDTDFNNEVDDHFALAWLLLQEKFPNDTLNKVKVEAVLIAPYSFKSRLDNLIKAYEIYQKSNQTPEDKKYLAKYETRIKKILALHTTPLAMLHDPQLNGGCDTNGVCDGGGIDGSYKSALEMFECMDVSIEAKKPKIFKGATHFMTGSCNPVKSEATKRLIELAKSATPDDPIYVLTLGTPTNVASALLIDPTILPNIVVVWDAGYPTNIEQRVNGSLNLNTVAI